MLKLTHPVIDLCIVCSNFGESLRFYHELLGLEIAADVQIPEPLATGVGLAPRAFRQVRLKAGNTLIKLMEIESPPAARPGDFAAGVRWLTFFVGDIQATVRELEAKGVKFLSKPLAASDAAGVVCAKAPDGILVEIVQV
jgi:glyoxylase I family protein